MRRRPFRRRARPHPAQVVLAGFALATAIGTGLLLLPVATHGPESATPIQAFFTAVSAISVTGHIIVPTPDFWSPFGQVVILLLIQLGGLGVMTFASIVGFVVVRRMSLRSRLTTATESKALGLDDLQRVVRGVLRTALVIEGAVALVLTLWFGLVYEYPWGKAIWYGVFHGVSSFNNAGFALFDDSLEGFASDPVVCLTIALSIILGGLGFPVLLQLRKHLRSPRLWSMNTRIVVFATPVLLILGSVYITAIEWNNPDTLGRLDPAARILAGFFQSVQTRTAGFDSVPIGSMHETTWLGMDVLMLIGGGPAGTAGGIKVTTFAVLLFILLAEVRGDGVVNVFGKRLSRAVHRQAIAVALVSLAVIITATGAIMLMTEHRLGETLFEVISAFSTVGLSTGITAGLPVGAQLVLAALMFVGRLGPITFATALALRERSVLYQYPKERPIIG
ncbi:MAG: hypothetical protein J0G30_02695 [Actinomycetales bacterium]|nr:hypothetical protein [Actinomycetales bacterium]